MDWKGSSAATNSISKFCTECITDHLFVFNYDSEIGGKTMTQHNTQNTLEGLQNFLFGQMERLDNPDLTPEELELEIKRGETMAKIADKAIENANTVINAMRFYDKADSYIKPAERPKMLEG